MKKKITPYSIEIRFSDCDLYGHLNNAVYLSYFEQARIHYFNIALESNWDWVQNGVILKKNEVEYHLPLTLNNQARVFIFKEKIGDKSVVLTYKIFNEKNELTTTGRSVLIAFDYSLGKSISINDELKKAILQFPSDELV